jgi:hypothetical protein
MACRLCVVWKFNSGRKNIRVKKLDSFDWRQKLPDGALVGKRLAGRPMGAPGARGGGKCVVSVLRAFYLALCASLEV